MAEIRRVWENVLLWFTREARSASAKQHTVHKYMKQESKLNNLFRNIIQGFLGLFVSSGLRVVSCLSLQNVLAAGAKHDRG